MNDGREHAHAMMFASDHYVSNPDTVPDLLSERADELAAMGARYVMVYRANREPSRILVLIGITSPRPVVEVLRSPTLLDWYESMHVDAVPVVFAGELLDTFAHRSPGPRPKAPGLLVAAFASVQDSKALAAELSHATAWFDAAGIRKGWIYRAFDDPQELLILQELDSEDRARRWLDHPDVIADWTVTAGVGAYPSLFVGRFMHLLRCGDG